MKTTTIDEGFIGRVYRTSAALGAFLLLACLCFRAFHLAAGWVVGSALSFGITRSLEVVIGEILCQAWRARARHWLSIH